MPQKKKRRPSIEVKPLSTDMAFIYKSEMDYISRCILDRPNIETGGQLFGFLTEQGYPVVCYAIGPGPKANHQVAFFNQDTIYLQSTYNVLNRIYGLRYIGEWHSHHIMGLNRPSGHDCSSVVNGMIKCQFKDFLLCIGNCDRHGQSTLNAFMFHINDSCSHQQVPWKIIDIDSPYRDIIDRDLSESLCHPMTRQPRHGANLILEDGGATTTTRPAYDEEYWLTNKANNKVLCDIINYLSEQGKNTHVRPMLDTENHVHLLVQDNGLTTEIIFGKRFPHKPPQIIIPEGAQVNASAKWQYDGLIYDSFVRYYHNIFNIYDNFNA